MIPVVKNLKEAIRLEYPSENRTLESNKPALEPEVRTEQDTLRILVGLLGVLLPFVLWLFVYFDTGHTKPISSISHYYYTRAGSFFVITMSLLAVFLMIYKGAKKIDFRLSFAAGVCALLVVFLPTTNIVNLCVCCKGDCTEDYQYVITHIQPSDMRAAIHLISAGIFLAILAGISFFRFTKEDSSKHIIEKYDKLIFRTCGILMIICIIIIGLGHLGFIMSKEDFKKYSLTFWFESIAVWAFGYSWLLKAEFFKKIRRFFTVAYDEGK